MRTFTKTTAGRSEKTKGSIIPQRQRKYYPAKTCLYLKKRSERTEGETQEPSTKNYLGVALNKKFNQAMDEKEKKKESSQLGYRTTFITCEASSKDIYLQGNGKINKILE